MNSATKIENGSHKRWLHLTSIIGVVFTISAMVGQLSGYFDFLAAVNQTIDGSIKFIAISFLHVTASPDLIALTKTLMALILIWSLFFLALLQYSQTYEKISLKKWIIEIRCFMKINKDRYFVEVALTTFIIFIIIPLVSISALLPPWRREKVVSIREMEIQLWPYLSEVFYLHAILFGALLAISSFIKAVGLLH